MKLHLRANALPWPPVSPEYLLMFFLATYFLWGTSEANPEFWEAFWKNEDRGQETILTLPLTKQTYNMFFSQYK